MSTRSTPVAGLELPATRVDAQRAVARFGYLDKHLSTGHDGPEHLDQVMEAHL